MAPDLFAAAAHLCQVGGVVPYFNPSPYGHDDAACEFHFDRPLRDKATEVAKEWRASLMFPEHCRDLWQILIKSWDLPINPGAYDEAGQTAPEWWPAALELVMIADIACWRIMRDRLDNGQTEEEAFDRIVKLKYDLAKKNAAQNDKDFRSPSSLTYFVDTSVACVLPKMRVAPVGATLRNISRNLSFLPGDGEVRCLWSNLSSKAVPPEDNESLDILLIPEPRQLSSTDFQAEQSREADPRARRRNQWSWDNFELRQTWIGAHDPEDADGPDKRAEMRKRFLEDCTKLLKKAQDESRNVNAVVLPEFAVDYPLFEDMCDQLKDTEPGLEFVIAGASSNCEGQEGNIVLTRLWDNRDAPDQYVTDSRRKHHRWRMNRRQVETYALSSALNPKIENWWEKTPLGRRELYFHRFRKASVFSVLICEELARSDPCHEILRAVAPNLIFALLLDGPQIRNRWPAQYASNLADDPGSSVLTFTSYGLIERSNKQGHFDANHSIAMWKDDTGKVVEIPMPAGDGPRGVLLSLWPEHVKDITMTGKLSDERAWRYASHFPIVL